MSKQRKCGRFARWQVDDSGKANSGTVFKMDSVAGHGFEVNLVYQVCGREFRIESLRQQKGLQQITRPKDAGRGQYLSKFESGGESTDARHGSQPFVNVILFRRELGLVAIYSRDLGFHRFGDVENELACTGAAPIRFKKQGIVQLS